MPKKMLSDKQLKFLRGDLRRINLLYGSVRSGKTWISLLKWAIWVGQQPKTQDFLMAGKTITTLKRNCLGLLESLIGDNVTYSTSQKKAEIFGRTVWLEGANDERSESKIRGMTLKGAYVDELTQIPQDFYLMLLSRLSESGAVLIATTNPDHPKHYVKTDIIDNEKLDKQVVKFLLDDNIFLDDEYKENLKKEYTGVYYQRFISGEFVRAEGIVFREFAEHTERYLIDRAGLPELFESVEVGFDIGGNGSAYALTASLIGRNNEVYVLRSRKKQAADLPMEEVEQFVFEFIDGVIRDFKVNIEYANCDHVDVVINTLNERRYIFGKTYKPPLEDRPFMFSGLMAKGKFKLVKGECGDLIDELQNLVFDEKSEKPIVLDDGSMQIDTWDSLTYSVARNWKYLI